MRKQPDTIEEYEEMVRQEQEEIAAADRRARNHLWLGLLLAILIGIFLVGTGSIAKVSELSQRSQSTHESQR